jgi:hypothetical protein
MHDKIEVLSTSYKEPIDRQDVNTEEACLHLNGSALAWYSTTEQPDSVVLLYASRVLEYKFYLIVDLISHCSD